MLSLSNLAVQSIVTCLPDELDKFSAEDNINLKNIITYPLNQKVNQIFCEQILNQGKNLELLNYFSDISDIGPIKVILSQKFSNLKNSYILLEVFPHLIKTINLSRPSGRDCFSFS